MNNQLLGALLKGERIKQQKSQKEICYGICAPSYLCKIENGKSNPDSHMWVQLFQKLNIQMDREEAKTIFFHKKIEEYFRKIKFNCERDGLYAELVDYDQQLRYSEFSVDWLFIRIDQGVDEWELLESLIPAMTMRQKAFYVIMKMSKGKLNDLEMEQFQQMCEVLDEPFAYNCLCLKYLHRGEFACVHRMEGKIVARALSEGNLYALADYYSINGAAYACVNQLEMMMDYYNRVIGLLEHSQWKDALTGVYYNMGASYVSIGDYEKGIDFLLLAMNEYQMEDFMLYHKLALAYVRLKDYEKARYYLEIMKKQLGEPSELKEADHLKYKEVCMEMEDGFQYTTEYLGLIEELIVAVERDYHVGHLVFYKDIAMKTFCLHRKYKKALELDCKISSIILENIY